ncbi:polyprenyl synthetase family protein [Streptomyces sp. NPDC087901]
MRLTQTALPDALESLERCRTLVLPALHDAVDRLHPSVARMASFAFGWCDVHGVRRGGSGGKGLRPALAVLCAEAVGGSSEDAVAGAVAVELVHAFSLVHDDIMDGDERRRHQETLWKAFGVGPAVLAGDALLALALSTIGSTAGAAAAMLSDALIELVEGQAADISFEGRPWAGAHAVTVDEYTAMAADKTGSLLACAAGLGALLGGGGPDAAAAMSTAGRHLGLGFQAIDDLLGIWGDPLVTGKPVFSDLRRRKKTLPVVFAATVDGGAHAGLLGHLLNTAPDAPERDLDLQRAADLIAHVGGRAFGADQSDGHLRQALEIIEATAVNPTAAAELTELARFVADRSH